MSKSDDGPDTISVADEIDRTARKLELSDPDDGLGRIDRAINLFVELIGVLALSGIVAVVFANATSRYLFGSSFSWAEETVQMTMPWLAMTGVFLSVRRGSVIRIDFFFEKLPERLRGHVARAGLTFNVVVLGILAWVSFDFVRLFGGDMSLYAGLPMGVSTSALVFGAAGAAMAFAAKLVSSSFQGVERQ